MPRYRFSWDNFDDESVGALAAACGYSATEGQPPREWLGENVKRPSDSFVRRTKTVLEDVWLPRHPRTARQIVNFLAAIGIGPRVEPETADGTVDYIRSCRNCKTFRYVLTNALIRHGDSDRKRSDEEALFDDTMFPCLVALDPKKQPVLSLKPYEYQEDAWKALSRHLTESRAKGRFRGLLVMPTGSGKTFTMVLWLVREHLNKGGRVLWVAHRHDLLEQASLAFQRAAHLASEIKTIRIRIVSGSHHPPTKICPEDNVVLWSIQSIRRRMDIAEDLLSDEDVFLVIDEAHHAAASSYRSLLGFLKNRPRSYVVGLTATPTRTVDEERPLLSGLFEGRKIHEVQFRDLVEQKFLARPMPEVVRTKVRAESGATSEDRRFLERFGELSEAWQQRLAKIVPRNEVITQQYVNNRKRYGKTLIFAINVAHAQLLCDRLREDLNGTGIEVEYIASYRLDDRTVDNREILERFRDPESGLDVLINVEILTEGVDVPNIQTVFLTRPTHSEILLRQMIGRAMRGPKIPMGTDVAYLVSFEDHWSEFTEWEHPFELVPDIIDCAPPPPPDQAEAPTPPKPVVDALPWELIKAVADAMRRRGPAYEADAYEAVPHGWYVLERDDEDVDVRQVIHVYKHQKSCWDELIKRLWTNDERCTHAPAPMNVTANWETEELSTRHGLPRTPDEFYEEAFRDCDSDRHIPKPSRTHFNQLLEHYLAGGDRPVYHAFADRELADPYTIAQGIVDQPNLGAAGQGQLISERYGLPFARAIYPTLRAFDSAVRDAIFEILNPGEATRIHRAEVIFEPLPNEQLTPGPAHDLETLVKEMLAGGAKILKVESLKFEGPIEWTGRPMRGWYGLACWEENEAVGEGRIRVNCILDSPDVSAEVVRFVLWHEFVHLHLHEYHTKKFRQLERAWPGCIEAERELYSLNERFGVWYW